MKQRPNILIFMTDQQRGDSISNPLIPTPAISQFRREGVTFSNAFCTSPHCCPSRASFFTGLYPSQHGVWNNIAVANALSRSTKENVGFFSDPLHKAGYQMYFSGKWHVSQYFSPQDIGWQEGPLRRRQPVAFRGGHHAAEEMEREKLYNWQTYEEYDGQKNKTCKPGDIMRPGYPLYTHYGTDDDYWQDQHIVDEAVGVLANRSPDDVSPWIQYIGVLGPHDPYFAPQQFLDQIEKDSIPLPESFDDRLEDKPALYQRIRRRYDQLSREQQRDALRHYYAFVAYMDSLFARVLQALDASGQRENTIVLFTSDHGDYAGDHGLWTKGLAGFRGAYHIPAVLRWPAGIQNPGCTVGELVSMVDFAPTFIDLCACTGDNLKDNAQDNLHGEVSLSLREKGPVPLLGNSLRPFLEDAKPENWRREIFTQSNGNENYGIQRIVFDQDYKFIFNGFDFDELYDLQSDPHETVNLIAKGNIQPYRNLVKYYYKKLWTHAKNSGDQYNNSYINTAYPDFGPGVIFEK